MNSLRILLAASFVLLAVTPSADAADCWTNPPRDAIKHPIHSDRYIHIDTVDPSKSGEWIESNGIRGLQTASCLTSGVYRYWADKRAQILA